MKKFHWKTKFCILNIHIQLHKEETKLQFPIYLETILFFINHKKIKLFRQNDWLTESSSWTYPGKNCPGKNCPEENCLQEELTRDELLLGRIVVGEMSMEELIREELIVILLKDTHWMKIWTNYPGNLSYHSTSQRY
jgi:hypothetical protein